MLKIRETQVEQLAPFRRRMRDLLRQHFADARAMSARKLDAAISRQTRAARSHGLWTERQLAVYILTAFLLGEEFDTRFPAAGSVLDSTLPPDAKVGWLEQWSKEILHTLTEGA